MANGAADLRQIFEDRRRTAEHHAWGKPDEAAKGHKELEAWKAAAKKRSLIR